ncbi:hypothetical protein ACFLZH_03030 [Patescibacteria group bacterium]
MLQPERPSNTEDIELPKPLQVACNLLIMEKINLDHFIDCFISEAEVDGKGKNLEASMAQIKIFLKEAFGYSDSKANKFIFDFIIELQTKLITLNIQQKTAQNAKATVKTL